MRKTLLILAISLTSALLSWADSNPTIRMNVEATSSDDKEFSNVTNIEGSAPVTATFSFETENADDWDLSFEWHFAHQYGNLDEPYMTRYEESPEVSFTQMGTDSIAIYAVFSRDGYKDVVYKGEYWHKGGEGESDVITVTATESKLTFPNAFSPNGDSNNDYYGPKEHISIVEFRAIIFNRWGQKIYEWNDVSDKGWDGTFHGSPVKQGTYFVLCTAKGADGRKFTIKKDVNLLRTYDNTADESSSSSSAVASSE